MEGTDNSIPEAEERSLLSRGIRGAWDYLVGGNSVHGEKVLDNEESQEENCGDKLVYCEEQKKDPCKFFLEGRCRFGERCRSLHPEGLAPKLSEMKEKKRKGKDASRQAEEKPTIKKRPPMKTAIDVIRRIQWDSDLPAEYFTIGYVDRFDGLVEEPFSRSYLSIFKRHV